MQRLAAPYGEMLHKPLYNLHSQQTHPAFRRRNICLNIELLNTSILNCHENETTTLCWRDWTQIARTGVGSVRRPKLILKLTSSGATSGVAMPVPSLMLTTQVDSAAPAPLCCYGDTANSMQANNFKLNLHLKYLCRNDCHADAARESHLFTIYYHPES